MAASIGSPAGKDARPLARIGGGDLPTITVDPQNENTVYSCSTVFWRTEDGTATWTAVRGAPGGDDYQKSWVNPNDPNIILLVADQGGVISANRGKSWSNCVHGNRLRRCITSPPITRSPIGYVVASRIPARLALTAAAWMEKLRFTTGIR